MSNKKRVHPFFAKQNEDSSSSSSSKRQKPDELTIWSWNVAGLRACVKKGGADVIANCGADIVLLQETKTTEFPPEIERISAYRYKKLLPSNAKKGHAGVAFLSREKPLKWNLKFFGDKIFDNQGRIIHAEYEDYHVIGVYVPNSGRDLVNLSMRKDWEDQLLEKLQELDESKPVIYAGDLNVAHNEIDLKNPEANRNKTAGFTDQERNDFTRMLAAGFTDTWRTMNPKKVAYTYFSYFSNCRAKNVGWRLDYFVISDRIYDKVTSCEIHKDEGSDHVPISLTIRL